MIVYQNRGSNNRAEFDKSLHFYLVAGRRLPIIIGFQKQDVIRNFEDEPSTNNSVFFLETKHKSIIDHLQALFSLRCGLKRMFMYCSA